MKNERRARALLRLSPKNVQNCLFNFSGRRLVETDKLALFFPVPRGPPAGENRGRQQPNPREPTARMTSLPPLFKQSIGWQQDSDHARFA
jgi:hypothetical protein